jgi:capsular exopolysaccharide synthesis family protein
VKKLVRNLSKQETASVKNMLVSYKYPESLISEQYRAIRTNLHFSSRGKKIHTLLITSPAFKDGKSVTLVNLAVSIANQKEKVLLIDANLKNPSLHNTFKLSNEEGLSNVLIGNIPLKEAIAKTDISTLDVLPSGPIPFNSSELIRSYEMNYLLDQAKDNYDMILIDAPPVLPVTDAKVLANLCDGVLLVMKCGKTNTTKAIEAKKVLELAGANILGVILNNK